MDDDPAPGHYEIPGTFQAKEPTSRRKQGYRSETIAETKALVGRLVNEGGHPPGPGTYDLPERQVLGRAWSKDRKVTKFIKDEQMRTRHIPGPKYDVLEALEATDPFCPPGGRTLMASKPSSYFDAAPKLFDGNPPPDKYDLPGSVQPKAVGRLVYRYESATLAETRDLINKLANDGSCTPGPGTYNVPDLPALGQAPTLKGRLAPVFPPPAPSFAPHPFAHNLAPAPGRGFAGLAPVRQQNSADQIFGTGVRRGASKGGAKGSKAPPDQVEPQELPPETSPPEDIDPEETVQWRSGGFSSLKKAKSAAAVLTPAPTSPRPEHPVLKEAAKFYPKLSRHHRDNSTFLPMMSKRCENISTRSGSDEYQRIRRGRWQLKAVAECIQNATAGVLEPLDEAKLREEALRGIREKAKYRMSLEGLASPQQNLVWNEMLGVFREHSENSLRPTTGVLE